MFLYGFSSCTCLYEWLSILLLYGFSSCTFLYLCVSIFLLVLSCTCLYEWLSISVERVFVMYMFVLMTIHNFELNVVISISVRMTTFSFWMDFRHVHFCTDDYLLIFNWFSSCTFLYGWLPSHFEWISVMYISVRMTTISFWKDCRHLHFCTDNYHFFLSWLLSCTFLYGWLQSLFEWILILYISCINDYNIFLKGLS